MLARVEASAKEGIMVAEKIRDHSTKEFSLEPLKQILGRHDFASFEAEIARTDLSASAVAQQIDQLFFHLNHVGDENYGTSSPPKRSEILDMSIAYFEQILAECAKLRKQI